MASLVTVFRTLASKSASIFAYGLNLFQQVPIRDAPPAVADQESAIIIGAGVIGLSTAYYLALSLSEHGPLSSQIFVIEPSHDICPGASGGATGGLGDFGFSEAVALLGNLSYGLHNDLASAYNGRQNWGFHGQTIYRITPKNFTGNPSPPDSWGPAPPVETGVSSLPSWIKPSDQWAVQLLAQAPHGSHIDPARFCDFLYKKCQELGVQFRFNSIVSSAQRATDNEGFDHVTIESKVPSLQTPETVPCKALVIAAGPWSSNVFSTLFPDARVRLHMNTTWAAGNHVRVRSSRWAISDNQISTQVFLNNVLPESKTMDITSFPDNSLYLGGWGAKPHPLPDNVEKVRPQEEEIDAMIELARHYLRLEPDDDLETFDIGRCYRPRASSNKPIITRVKWSLLGSQGKSLGNNLNLSRSSQLEQKSALVGGLYVNTGHDSDGVTLAPGSGKIMSEILLGRTTSVPISGFELE